MLTFNGLLAPTILHEIGQCFRQKATNQFALQNATIGFGTDPVLINCVGKFRVSFSGDDRSSIHLDFTSLYEELKIPLTDHGKLGVEINTEVWRPLSERLQHVAKHNFHANIAYPDMAPVTGIQFYGDQVNDFLNVIHPDISIEHLQEKYGLTEFPRIICNSIEFVVLEHANNRKTILALQYGGFRVLFYVETPDLLATLTVHSSPEKKIILQQEVD